VTICGRSQAHPHKQKIRNSAIRVTIEGKTLTPVPVRLITILLP
jgi:hypothetical protein